MLQYQASKITNMAIKTVRFISAYQNATPKFCWVSVLASAGNFENKLTRTNIVPFGIKKAPIQRPARIKNLKNQNLNVEK